MDIQTICNIVILIGAVVVAITNIAKFFGKPFGFFKKKREKEEQKRLQEEQKHEEKLKEIVENALEETLPKYFEQHDLETREKYLADRLRYLKEIKTEVENDISGDLVKLQKQTEEQEITIELLRKQAVDVLRQKIETIYYDYRAERAFPRYIKENLDELYTDYTRGGGNHHIEKLYKRMLLWDITEELPEYDRE